MAFLIPLIILGGVVLYLMTPQERMRLLKGALAAVLQLLHMATQTSPESERFGEFLRGRTRWPFATPAIVLVNIVVFGQMVVVPGSVSDPQTLMQWGANYGPLTTNGEWWRLVTATFVHSGFLHLLAITVGLVPLGLVLERLVGPLAFATAYVAAGVVANLVSLSESALAVSSGGSGAVCGVYGLLVGALVWIRLRAASSRQAPRDAPARHGSDASSPNGPPAAHGRIEVPMIVAKRVGAAFAIFAFYNLLTSDLRTSGELAGLAAGLAGGLGILSGIGAHKPPPRRIALAAAATVVLAIGSALPLRGVADVRPALERLVLVEERTAAAYDARVGEYRKGWITEEVLVQQIERTILPELRAAHARLMSVKGVPREHRPIVAAAEEYFRLRERAWLRRAEGLIETSMRMLQEADQAERESLAAFQRLKSSGVLSRST